MSRRSSIPLRLHLVPVGGAHERKVRSRGLVGAVYIKPLVNLASEQKRNLRRVPVSSGVVCGGSGGARAGDSICDKTLSDFVECTSSDALGKGPLYYRR